MELKVYERISTLAPKGLRDAFERELSYSDLGVEGAKFTGFVLATGLLFSVAVALNLFILFSINAALSLAASYAVFVGAVYLWVSFISDNKASFVEKILPDALQLIAVNVKSGLTTEEALFASAREDFGPLAEELKAASRRISTGSPVEEALFVVTKRIKSKIVERTVWLITEGIRSGGELGELLMQISNDLREQAGIQEDIKANVSLYTLLILFAAVVGAPILFGVSTFIVQVLRAQFVNIQVPAAAVSSTSSGIAGALLGGAQAGVSPEFVFFFSLVNLFVSSLFAALTIGVINTGKEKNGFKYLIPIFGVSLALFYATRELMVTTFGQLL